MAHLSNIKEGDDLEEIATTVQQQIMEQVVTNKRRGRKRAVPECPNIFDLPISPPKKGRAALQTED